MTREDDAGRVYNKISRAVDDELNTDIVGACAATIVEAIVDSAPDIATALRAFDALVGLTRQRLVDAWDEEHTRSQSSAGKGPLS
jgi:hypothetical protein